VLLNIQILFDAMLSLGMQVGKKIFGDPMYCEIWNIIHKIIKITSNITGLKPGLLSIKFKILHMIFCIKRKQYRCHYNDKSINMNQYLSQYLTNLMHNVLETCRGMK